MTALLALYSAATWALSPLARPLLQKRVKDGKERPERMAERLGVASASRPGGVVVWMHAASVGESRLLLDLFAEMKAKRPDISAVLTTQTLTSADMAAARKQPGVIHQMAPVDSPHAVHAFLDHWAPNAAVFAEGEIWPNMLQEVERTGIPGALVNARMTAKSLDQWSRWSGAARKLFRTFDFIGAADKATAEGLELALNRRIDVVGNLKRASKVQLPDGKAIDAWREALGVRTVLLAASTHPGEDEFALDAFSEARMRAPGALLVIVPRHPARGPDIAELARGRGLTTQLRSADAGVPDTQADVLVADTMGELMFWYAVADAVYLGGATMPGIGGHNPVEPIHLGKRAFTGPHGFNFAETFAELRDAELVVIGDTYGQLAEWWLGEIEAQGAADPAKLAAFLAVGSGPFDATLKAVLEMLPPESANA